MSDCLPRRIRQMDEAGGSATASTERVQAGVHHRIADVDAGAEREPGRNAATLQRADIGAIGRREK